MTLSIQDLGALGELLGSVAVLATLVYLALQTRQNTMAIAAQLDAARISASLHIGLTLATSTELQEALLEDRIDPPAINELRRNQLWTSLRVTFQWELVQARRGLLPTYSEASARNLIRNLFNRYRSFGGFWEIANANYLPEFVEFVEEQRAKAA